MFLCLLLGAVLAVGMVTSIPMYTEGVLNRMLRRDLEMFQERSGNYPGRFMFDLNIVSYPLEKRLNNLNYFGKNIEENKRNVDLPIVGETRGLSLTWLNAKRAGNEGDPGANLKVHGQTGLFERVSIVAGRYPAKEPVNGVYEVMISQALMRSSRYLLDQEYDVADTRNRTLVDGKARQKYDMKFKIVGVFDILPTDDIYWYDFGHAAESGFVMDYDLIMKDFVYVDNCFLQSAVWYIGYDYREIKVDTLPTITKALDDNLAWLKSFYAGPATTPALDLLKTYNNREQTLRTMLSVMQVPILIMLAFYLFMVTQLILSSEKAEIAVLKSRGASRWQIMLIYLAESLIIAGIALCTGPPLAYFICSMLGASNGFLEFVSRTALPIEITPNAVMFAVVAALGIILMILIPAFFASKVGIVEQKQGKVKGKIAFWKKTGIDIILIGVAAYGWYAYQMRQITLQLTGGSSIDVPVDPLLFLLSTAFIMGAGLLFLRFYPLMIRAIYFIGRKAWSPSLYASFVQVGRSGGQEQFLMLFLIITLSLGIFSANSANTININVEEKILYQSGAEMALTPIWRSNERTAEGGVGGGGASSASASTTVEPGGFGNSRYITYIEPPFSAYASVDGVKDAAKVFIKDDASFQLAGKSSTRGVIMAIDPPEFGKVAFMPDGLLGAHWYNYLNLLSYDINGALISRALADKTGLQSGDSFNAMWSEQNPISLVVFGIIDYWPTYNPQALSSKNFVVCNLDRVRASTALEPYKIWYTREEGATSAQIYQSIEEKKLGVERIVDSGQLLVAAKNDPMLQGTNGALTMAFIVTMTISFFGFIIYWVLSIRSRQLQFGILRAMGMSMRSIIGMLLWEQILISGVAILAGVILGGATAQIFTPLLQMVYDAADQVPPFRVVANRGDYVKIYSFIGIMLSIGFAALGVMISRIRIAQALKLGED